jgi:benzoyl-CoA reductase/2-hydroxyglutaryl-CoA dehydratase subunit BcrC/BadD/HgdB
MQLGYTCSYTPVPLLHAAGFTPYRILPHTDVEDQAGTLLHDNLCPEVKRVLDRQLAGELPPLAGTVFVNSCDAMRRLANAWATEVGEERVFLLDLPIHRSEGTVTYLAGQLEQLAGKLVAWGGEPVNEDTLAASIGLYEQLQDRLEELGTRAATGTLAGGRARWQGWVERSGAEEPDRLLDALESELTTVPVDAACEAVPLTLFGNVMPGADGAALLEECGARIVGDDLCSGSRQFTRVPAVADRSALSRLAEALLERPLCARTLEPARPDALAEQALTLVQRTGARGAVAHVVKFCDPYLLRLPALRAAFQRAGVPLLVLEGDCTLRSLGQQRTRIEAFVEMLREAP